MSKDLRVVYPSILVLFQDLEIFGDLGILFRFWDIFWDFVTHYGTSGLFLKFWDIFSGRGDYFGTEIFFEILIFFCDLWTSYGILGLFLGFWDFLGLWDSLRLCVFFFWILGLFFKIFFLVDDLSSCLPLVSDHITANGFFSFLIYNQIKDTS